MSDRKEGRGDGLESLSILRDIVQSSGAKNGVYATGRPEFVLSTYLYLT